MNQTADDEIDFFALFQTLWGGKWIISACILIALLTGGGLHNQKVTVFQSEMMYSIGTLPPFYTEKVALRDFERMFYSQSIFQSWKKSSSNTSLKFSDFSKTKVVGGFVLAKGQDEGLASLKLSKTGERFVKVKTNQLNILTDFFDYANYVSVLIKDNYLMRARNELNIIETKFENYSTATVPVFSHWDKSPLNEAIISQLLALNDSTISQLLELDRFIVATEEGAMVLVVERPTQPRGDSLGMGIVLFISGMLGGAMGGFVTIVRHAALSRKKQVAEA